MCIIIDSETYLGCGHNILCYLKYGLVYCKCPNGVPFENPEIWHRKYEYFNRFCKEEKWISKSMMLDGSCRDCRRERRQRKKEKMEREKYGDGYNDGGLSEAERRERYEKYEEDEDKSDYDSTSDLDSEPDSATMYLGEEDKTPGGVMTTYSGCGCSLVFYEGGKLQRCFEKKSTFTQEAIEGAERGTKRRHSPDIGDPDQSRLIPRAPTPPPNEDMKLIEAHEAAEREEFSTEEWDLLACSRKYRSSMCGDCERKRVLAGLRSMAPYIVKRKGFRRRKPTGLWVFPGQREQVEGMVAARGQV